MALSRQHGTRYPAHSSFPALPAATSLKYIEIQEATNIDSDDLERTLASLVFAKHKLLSKEPMGRTINSTDTFAYNAGFKDRMRRIRVSRWVTRGGAGRAVICRGGPVLSTEGSGMGRVPSLMHVQSTLGRPLVLAPTPQLHASLPTP